MQQYTEEQNADFQERAKAFQLEHDPMYEELSKKHQIEILYSPVTVPSPSGVFGLAISSSLGDLKYKSIPSPLNGSIIDS